MKQILVNVSSDLMLSGKGWLLYGTSKITRDKRLNQEAIAIEPHRQLTRKGGGRVEGTMPAVLGLVIELEGIPEEKTGKQSYKL